MVAAGITISTRHAIVVRETEGCVLTPADLIASFTPKLRRPERFISVCRRPLHAIHHQKSRWPSGRPQPQAELFLNRREQGGAGGIDPLR